MPRLPWLTAREEIATILTGVAISEPFKDTIKRVYLHPYNLVTDDPAVMCVGLAKAEPVRSSGLCEREYTMRLRLIVKNADLDVASALIDAFQEAITTAFDENLTLNGKVSNLNGPQWLEPGMIEAGGQDQMGCDAFVRFRMFDDPVFAP